MKHFIIYKTTNLINEKTYIGMHGTDELNDGYLGSGVAFTKALKKYGKENFDRVILEHADSYDELIELEKKYVNEKWVSNRDNYNLKTGGQSSGLLSEESKDKISKTLKAKYKSGELTPNYEAPYIATEEQKKQISETLKERYKTHVHPTTGVEPWNKGKKGVQVPWNKGIETGPMSEEQKAQISETLKDRWKTQVHPRTGKTAWNKGTKGLQVAWNKGKKAEKIECPHCGKLSNHGNAKRWHFDNCKSKKI